MKSKAIWLAALGLSGLATLACIPLSQATLNLWKPEVAQAAKITAQLFNNKSLNPVKLARHRRTDSKLVKPNMAQMNTVLLAGRNLDPKRTAR